MQVHLNGIDIFYSISGTGRPIVLIHGYPLDHTIWDPQREYLSENYVVITPDLRGHGKSGSSPGPYTMDLLARDVHALIDHLHLEPVVLGGLSMGGYVALAFMRLFPQKVRGLILVDTRAEADTDEARSRREQQAQTVLRNGTKEVVDQMAPKMFTERTAREDPKLVGGVRRMMESTSPTGIAGALLGMAQRPDSTPFLGSIRVPTLILVGAQDSITTVDHARKMASGIPDSQLVVVPDAAHLTTLERPQEVNAAIGGFLSGLSAKTGLG